MNETDDKSSGGVTSRGFVKGDRRINRAGRPRSFDQLRSLALQIAAERVIAPDGSVLTRAEQLLRSWAKSRVPALQLAFATYAWGKPPEKVEMTNELRPKIKLVLRYAHEAGQPLTPYDLVPPNVAREMRRLSASSTDGEHSGERLDE